MKKTKWVLGILAALLVIGTMGFFALRAYQESHIFFLSTSPVSIHWEESGDPTIGFTQTLTDEDAAAVRSLLGNYRYELGGDGAGCPLDSRVSITIGSTKFLLGQDQCQVVKNAETEQLFQMSDEDWQVLAALFSKYGGRI